MGLWPFSLRVNNSGVANVFYYMSEQPGHVTGLVNVWGQVVNVVVWSGDPFEMLTNMEHLFIRGQEIPLVSRETQLRDRYRTLDESRRSYGNGTSR